MAKFFILSAHPASVCVERESERSVEGTAAGRDEFLDAFSRTRLVHAHARVVRVGAETYDHDAVFLGEDGLIHGPAVAEVGEEIGHRGEVCGAASDGATGCSYFKRVLG